MTARRWNTDIPARHRVTRAALGALAIGAALAMAPPTAAAAPTTTTTTVVDSVSAVQRSMQPVTITATVRGRGSPLTGKVELRNAFDVASSAWDGRFRNLGEATCPGTSAKCTVTITAPTLLPSPDVNQVVARYSGDPQNDASESAPAPVTVAWATTTPTVSQRAATTVYGQPVQIDASLALDPPSTWVGGDWYGRSWVYATDVASGRRVGSLSNPAALELTGLGAGSHRIAVEWDSASIFPWPWRAPAPVHLDHVVTKAATTLELRADVTSSSVHLLATLAAVPPGGGAATGEIVFSEGDEVIARAPVTGNGAFVAAPLPAGTHAVRAAYAGDANFEPSTSPERTVTVTEPPSTDVPVTPAPELLRARATRRGAIVAHVRCAAGRVRVTAKRRGLVYARSRARCTGDLQRLVLKRRRAAKRAGAVLVVARFGDGGRDRLRIRLRR